MSRIRYQNRQLVGCRCNAEELLEHKPMNLLLMRETVRAVKP